MSAPAVSVVMPTYNRAAFIEAAIATVRAQSVASFELIVVDDRSNDATGAILSDLAVRDSRIVPLANDGPRGPGGARNAGIARARGDWIAFLDSDDRWEPRKLERFLASAAGRIMVASDYAMVDRVSNTRQTMRAFVFGSMVPWWESDALARLVIPCTRLRLDVTALADPAVLRGMAIGGFLWPHTSSVMVRRDALAAVGGFDARLARTEDMDLWLRLIDRGRLAYVDEVLADYDITGRDDASGGRYAGQDRVRLHDRYSEAAHHLRFLQSLPARFPLDDAAASLLRERIAAHHRMCGHAALRRSSPRAFAHYAAALWSSAEQRRRFVKRPRRYLRDRD